MNNILHKKKDFLCPNGHIIKAIIPYFEDGTVGFTSSLNDKDTVLLSCPKCNIVSIYKLNDLKL